MSLKEVREKLVKYENEIIFNLILRSQLGFSKSMYTNFFKRG